MGNKEKFKTQKLSGFWVFAIAVIMPLAYFPYEGIFNAYIPRFIFLALAGLLILPFFAVNIREYFFNDFKETEIKLLLAYYALLIVSIFFAKDKQSAVFGYLRFDGVIVITIYLIIFFVARKIKTIERKFIYTILSIASLVSIHAILQKYYLDPIPEYMYYTGRYGLAQSTMGNPNYLGSYLALLIPFCFYLFIEKNMKIAFVSYGLLFYALLCSRTRGAWIGGFLALVSFLIFKQKASKFISWQKINVIKIIILSIVLVLIMSISDNFEFVLRFLSIFFDFGDFLNKRPNLASGGYVRLVIWEKVIEIIRNNPIVGIGVENLGQVMELKYREYMYSKVGMYQIYDTAHNEYLHIAVTSGLPSLVFYVGFFYHTLKKSISKAGESDIYLPVSASLIGFLAFSLFNNSLIMFEYLVWILLGLSSSNNVIRFLSNDSTK